MSIEAMKRIKSLLQDTKMIDSHTISAVVAECDAVILSQQPATTEPVGFTYQAEIAYANSTVGNGSFWRVPPDLDDEAVPLYTHPAPSVPDDVVRDAERYRWLRSNHPIHDNSPFICRNFGAAFSQWTGDQADKAIDAAIAASREGKS